MADLLKLWLEESVKDRQDRCSEAERSLAGMKDQTTTYARAIRTLARAHDRAAEVYSQALEDHLRG